MIQAWCEYGRRHTRRALQQETFVNAMWSYLCLLNHLASVNLCSRADCGGSPIQCLAMPLVFGAALAGLLRDGPAQSKSSSKVQLACLCLAEAEASPIRRR